MTDPGPFLPRVQEVYWVDGTILPFEGAADQAVVVVDVPATVMGTIGVGVGRGAARFPVPGVLWTPANVIPVP